MDKPTEQQEEAHQRKDNVKISEATAGSIKDSLGTIGGPFLQQANPPFIQHRNEIFQ